MKATAALSFAAFLSTLHPASGLLFQINLDSNTIDTSAFATGFYPETGTPWFTDLTGDGNSDVSFTDAEIDNDGTYQGIQITVGSSELDVSTDGGGEVDEGFVSTDFGDLRAFFPITFNPPGSLTPVTGILEATTFSDGGANIRSITFTRVIWDDTSTITEISSGDPTPNLVGTTAEFGEVSIFTPAPLRGLFQINLEGNIIDTNAPITGTINPSNRGETLAPENGNAWFSDLTGDGLSDIVIGEATINSSGSFQSIEVTVDGVDFDLSVDFDEVTLEGVDGAFRRIFPITFSPPKTSGPVTGILECTVFFLGTDPGVLRFSMTRLIWDTESTITEIPNELPQLYGTTSESNDVSLFSHVRPGLNVTEVEISESGGNHFVDLGFAVSPDSYQPDSTYAVDKRNGDGSGWTEVGSSMTPDTASSGTIRIGDNLSTLGTKAIFRLRTE